MMNNVRPKKHLGQHFLTDRNIAEKIVASLSLQDYHAILEVGPGKGILTELLLKIEKMNLKCIDIDTESIQWLKEEGYPEQCLIEADFLKMDILSVFREPFAVIGNFPYNISSQILFKILGNRDSIPEMVGMFQKEVAERIAANHGNKSYGILSVLVQSYFDVSLLFTVGQNVFFPPPKVMSAVIRLTRKPIELQAQTEYSALAQIVKAAFGQRRKMLRNSLSAFGINTAPEAVEWLTKRPEQLSVAEFHSLVAILKKEKS
jgi:16S rRNA (adenine1518-N6/adenine1519-N6)-dimethyltransferase